MYAEANHVYTNKGIYSIYDLYNLKQNNLLNTIKIMSFDTTNYVYQFVDIADITYPDTEYKVYEISFIDMLSKSRLIVNGTDDINIYQFDAISSSDDYLTSKKLKVNQYIQYMISNNLTDTLHFGKKPISSLVNYSVHMPNLSLGDNLIKYEKSVYRTLDRCYNIIDSEGKNIPIFIGQAISAYYNFVLVD